MSEVRKFAEQTHRDEAKRSRDDHFSEEYKRLVVWSFDEQSESNFLRVCFMDLCEVLKVYTF